MDGFSHIGRSFGDDTRIENECICPQEPCGLIATDKVDGNCEQHGFTFAKTIRQSHSPEDCPVKPRRAYTETEQDNVLRFHMSEHARYRALAVEQQERIEKAKASLAYFGPQGDNIVAILEGRS